MEVRNIAADALFRACFTGCPQDPRTLLLDVRTQKAFKRKHILQVQALVQLLFSTCIQLNIPTCDRPFVSESQQAAKLFWSVATQCDSHMLQMPPDWCVSIQRCCRIILAPAMIRSGPKTAGR